MSDEYARYYSKLAYIESQQRSLSAEIKSQERYLLRPHLRGDQNQQREEQAPKFGNSESEDTSKSIESKSLISQVRDLISKVDYLKSEVIDLKAQVIDLKAQVPDLKSEVLGLKSQVHGLTAEVLHLKS